MCLGVLHSKMRKLNMAMRDRVIDFLIEGKSSRDISRELKCSKSTINNLRTTVPKAREGTKKGRPRKVTARCRRQIVHEMTQGTQRTPRQVAAALQEWLNISITSQTVRNSLKEAGLKARKRVKKPALSLRHKSDWLNFAMKYKEWTVEDWKKVIWSDETKINRIDCDGIPYTWRTDC